MRPATLFCAALSLTTGCSAFVNTSPLLAWSSAPKDQATSLVLINAPGLRQSDLADLDDASAIRKAWAAADADQRVHVPFLQAWKHPIVALEEKLPCTRTAEVEMVHLADFQHDHPDRRRALRALDDLVSQQTTTFDGSSVYAIISHAGLDLDSMRLRKRQAIDFEPSRPAITPLQQDDDDGGKGNSSEWKPDPNAPALARYSIITPIQVIVLLIVLLIILPAVVWTVNLLTEISLPHGLVSGKMKGDTASKEKKDQ